MDSAVVDPTEDQYRTAIRRQPHSFKNHARLMQHLVDRGDQEKLRAARMHAHEFVPLTEIMWSEWIATEKDVEESHTVIQLYGWALDDYASPTLATSLLDYITELLMSDDIPWEAAEGVLERLAGILGFDHNVGEAFWGMYSYLCTQYGDSANKDSLSRRAESARDFRVSVNDFESRVPPIEYSEGISETPSLWIKYLVWVCDEDLPYEHGKYIFEHAVRDMFLHEEVWRLYISWLHDMECDTESICARSVKNLPLSAELWGTYVWALLDDKESLDNVYRTAMSLIPLQDLPGFTSTMVCVAIKYGELAFIQECAFGAYEVVQRYISGIGMARDLLGLIKFVTELYATLFDDVSKGREIWKVLIDKDSSHLFMWRGMLDFEMQFGDLDSTREVYLEAVKRISDPVPLYKDWTLFEQSRGTLDTAESVRGMRDQYWRHQLLQESMQPKSVSGKKRATEKPAVSAAKKPKVEKQSESRMEVDEEKQKATADMRAGSDFMDQVGTVLVTNIAFDAKEERLCDVFSVAGVVDRVRIVLGKDNHLKTGRAFVDFQDPEAAGVAIDKLNGSDLDGRRIGVVQSRVPVKAKIVIPEQKEPRTVFIVNLPFATTADELKTLFGTFGTIQGVRFAARKKGIAFVEFDTEEQAKSAVEALHGFEFNGRNLRVSISCPPVKSATKLIGNSLVEERVICIKNIAHDVDTNKAEEQLRLLLNPCGDIEKVAFVYTTQGKFRGMCFVTFVNDASCDAACLLIAPELMGSKLKISRSRPLDSGPSKKKPVTSTSAIPLRPAAARKSRLFVPSSVRRPKK